VSLAQIAPSRLDALRERLPQAKASAWDTATHLHPDLLELGVGIVDVDGRPAIQLVTRHPHARGFEVALGADQWRLPPACQAWPIPIGPAGDHTATVATITEFGSHRAYPLRFVLRSGGYDDGR